MFLPHRAKLILTCLCVLITALCNGSIFIFPLLSPSIANRLKVSQLDLTWVALSGLMGQYMFAVACGLIMDVLGTWACSLTAGLLYFVGYGFFEYTLQQNSSEVISPSTAIWYLVLCNFLVGLATVSSYFGFLFATIKNYPGASGLATGAPLAVFGLSPLFLSLIASEFFLDHATGLLDSSRFLIFLATLTGGVNLFGAAGLQMWSTQTNPSEEDRYGPAGGGPEQVSEEPTETTVLLSTQSTPISIRDFSLVQLLCDAHFWAFLLVILVTTGSCEMVMANIGTIISSLMPDVDIASNESGNVVSPHPTLSVRKLHVQLISAFNTGSRIISGFLADRYAPSIAQGVRRVSRLSFVTCAAALLCVAYAWTAWGLKSQSSLWVLSVAVGAAYGTVFTISPPITASVWGQQNVGRNWGILSYAPLIGTPIFTFLYARVSSHVGDGSICEGASCFRPTFVVCSLATTFAAAGCFVLTRRWHALV